MFTNSGPFGETRDSELLNRSWIASPHGLYAARTIEKTVANERRNHKCIRPKPSIGERQKQNCIPNIRCEY